MSTKRSQLALFGIMFFSCHGVHPQQRNQDIRSVDFANFTYSRTADASNKMVLRDGREKATVTPRSLVQVDYIDVTRDGVEEAIVILAIQTGGSAMPNEVYIYAMLRGRPKRLWAFTSGDRADGGLRRVYGENGQLIIELYGKGARIGGKLYGTEAVGACCPRSVTRTRYQWRVNRFRQIGKSTIFPNPEQHGSPVRGHWHCRAQSNKRLQLTPRWHVSQEEFLRSRSKAYARRS